MLLILGCSKTKKIHRGPRSFHEVYDGVFWRIARTRYSAKETAAISAKHGVLAPGDKIEDYDQVMDEATALRFISDKAQMDKLEGLIREHDGAFVCAGAPYRMLTNVLMERDKDIKRIVKYCRHGTIDKMTKDLTVTLDKIKRGGFF